MASRDSQTVILSRQTILLVTAVGVGLLTLCYVLGVQVGKQSAALRRPVARGSGEDLQELPASIADQLKALEAAGGIPAGLQAPQAPSGPAPEAAPGAGPAPAPSPQAAPAPPPPALAPHPQAPPPVEVRLPAPPKPEAPGKKAAPAPDAKPGPAPHWTLQLISTPDQAEAQRMVDKVQAAGFRAGIVSEKGLFKVRLTGTGPREALDATAQKLKNRGFKPFAIKIE